MAPPPMPNTPARNPDSAPTAISSKASSMSSLGSRPAIMSLSIPRPEPAAAHLHGRPRDLAASGIREYPLSFAGTLAEYGRIDGPDVGHGDLCPGGRRRQPVGGGAVAAEFIDVGEPADLGAGAAFRDPAPVAHDAPARAHRRGPASVRARQSDPQRGQGDRGGAVARPPPAVGTNPGRFAKPDGPACDS